MPHFASHERLKAQIVRNWEAAVDRPNPIVVLIKAERDIVEELRQIARQLDIAFIRLQLSQTVTPDHHMQLMVDKPRLVAITGLETLTNGERDSLVRLLNKGPRTFAMTWCVVEPERVSRITRAWHEIKAVEIAKERRATRLAEGIAP
jgi:hypothetical protein